MESCQNQQGHRQSVNRNEIHRHQDAAQCRTDQVGCIDRSNGLAGGTADLTNHDAVLVPHEYRNEHHEKRKQEPHNM